MNNGVEELEAITIPTKIKYKGIIWIPEPKKPQTKKQVHNIKQNYFIKWLHKNKQVGDVFSLDEFYQEYPKHKKDAECKRRIDIVISNLIKEGKIDQWINKDEFKVLKKDG